MEEILEKLLKAVQDAIDPTASRIGGENVIGVETADGEYFIEVQGA